jgi:carbon storage regulator CsrA
MLVLSHHRGEAGIVTLPGNIRCEVRVVAIGPDRVRLGYTFPKDVSIHRDDVQDRIDGIEPQPKPSLAAILKTRKD